MQKIIINKEIRDELLRERSRAGISFATLANRMEGWDLSGAGLCHIFAGDVQTIDKDKYEAILSVLKSTPDHDGKIKLTDEILAELSAEMNRTAYNVARLFKEFDNPAFSLQRLNKIFSGKVQIIDREEHALIVRTLKSLPDDDMVLVPDRTLDLIERYLDENLELVHAVQYDPDKRPDKLTTDLVRLWLKKDGARAKQDHISYMDYACEALMQNDGIPDRDIQEFKDLLKVTNRGLSQISKDIKGLSIVSLRHILNGRHVAHQKDNFYQALDVLRKVREDGDYYVSMEPYHDKLLSEHDRVGLSPQSLVDKHKDLLHGMSGAAIYAYIRRGKQKIKLYRIENLLKAYSLEENKIIVEPKKAPPIKISKEPEKKLTHHQQYEPIPDEVREELAYYKSMKILPTALYKIVPYKKEYPSSAMINGWCRDAAKKAIPSDVELVLGLCEEYLKTIGDEHKIYKA